MKSGSSPLLIIGTQRSGSNLLRLILNQSPGIEAPHPPHLLHTFVPLLSQYGDLTQPENFGLLIDDILQFIATNPVPWVNVELTKEKVLARCSRPTIYEVFKSVYELKAEHKNAQYWCCKSMANLYYIDGIEQSGIKPFYVHLLRDGRDVAASFKNAIVGEKHIYFIAQQWKRDQELAVEFVKKMGPERSHVLYFEDFIDHPQRALQPVLDKLGLEWRDEMLEYYLSEEAKNTAAAGAMWRNVIKPIDRNNTRHYSEKLSPEEILIFEKIAGDVLKQCGYAIDNSFANLKADFDAEEIALFKQQNEQGKTEASQKYLLDAAVRENQENVVAGIKARFRAEKHY